MPTPDIPGLIADAASRTDALTGQLTTFLNALERLSTTNFARSINIDKARGAFNSNVNRQIEGRTPRKPSGLGLQKPVPVGPAPSDFNIRDSAEVEIPDFNISSPTLLFPAVPKVSLPDKPAPPVLQSADIPVPPDLNLPEIPTLPNIDYPDAPSIQLPVFNEVFPEAPELLLSATYNYTEELFQNDVLDDIHAQLMSDIESGEFGIDIRDEELLYDRQQDRIAKSHLARENEVLNTFSQRGFLFPPGVLVANMESNKQETSNAVSDINREVSTTRAELYRRGREFAIQQGLTYSQMLVTDYGFRQERALNDARFAAEFGVALFDAEIRKYNAYVTGYQAFTSAYESQIRGLLATVDIYRTEVQAAVEKQRGNQIQVEVYNSQINAANTLVNLFEAQMRGAALQTEIERTKTAAYSEQIRAFVAEIQAAQTEFEIYNTQVSAERQKSEIFSTQVSAYEAEVRAAAAKSAIANTNAQIDVDKARLEVQAYAADVERYRANLTSEIARVEALTTEYGIDSEVFRTLSTAWASLSDTEVRHLGIFYDKISEENRSALEEARIRLGALVAQSQTSVAASTAGASAIGTIAAAAQESINLLGASNVVSEAP